MSSMSTSLSTQSLSGSEIHSFFLSVSHAYHTQTHAGELPNLSKDLTRLYGSKPHFDKAFADFETILKDLQKDVSADVV